MKANRKYKDSEEAVSAVIGVILMVAITVAIAATVYVYVSGMIGGGDQSAPNISWTPDTADNEILITKGSAGDAYGTSTAGNLKFTNESGDVYYVNDSMGLQTGDVITFEENDVSAGDVITGFYDGEWTIVWIPTDTVIGKVNL